MKEFLRNVITISLEIVPSLDSDKPLIKRQRPMESERRDLWLEDCLYKLVGSAVKVRREEIMDKLTGCCKFLLNSAKIRKYYNENRVEEPLPSDGIIK